MTDEIEHRDLVRVKTRVVIEWEYEYEGYYDDETHDAPFVDAVDEGIMSRLHVEPYQTAWGQRGTRTYVDEITLVRKRYGQVYEKNADPRAWLKSPIYTDRV